MYLTTAMLLSPVWHATRRAVSSRTFVNLSVLNHDAITIARPIQGDHLVMHDLRAPLLLDVPADRPSHLRPLTVRLPSRRSSLCSSLRCCLSAFRWPTAIEKPLVQAAVALPPLIPNAGITAPSPNTDTSGSTPMNWIEYSRRHFRRDSFPVRPCSQCIRDAGS